MKKGLTPLEEIIDANHKVPCIDEEGYKYLLSYHTGVGDKRTKSFNKWNKNNPFKAYNMRLYATKVQCGVNILSADEELFNATINKIKFRCPSCGEKYYKKWCHWIAQPLNKHLCPKCNEKSYSNGNSQYSILTEDWLNDNKIPFTKEYKFKDCKDKRELRFDFYIQWKQSIILIEVDGMQHYYLSTWTTQDRLEKTKQHDLIKEKYCKENNYILVRIPYWLYRTDTYKKILNKTFFG